MKSFPRLWGLCASSLLVKNGKYASKFSTKWETSLFSPHIFVYSVFMSGSDQLCYVHSQNRLVSLGLIFIFGSTSPVETTHLNMIQSLSDTKLNTLWTIESVPKADYSLVHCKAAPVSLYSSVHCSLLKWEIPPHFTPRKT